MKREKLPNSRLLPPAQKIGTPNSICFSFKHLDLYSNAKFSVALCRDGYLEKLLCRLRDLCTLSAREFRANKSQAIKAHKITWSDTTEVAGFTCLNEQLRDAEAWQFHITKNEHGRIHGILVEDTFFVVWIDPDHLLYN